MCNAKHGQISQGLMGCEQGGMKKPRPTESLSKQRSDKEREIDRSEVRKIYELYKEQIEKSH